MRTEYKTLISSRGESDQIAGDRNEKLNTLAADGWTLVTTTELGGASPGNRWRGEILDTLVRTR